MKTKNDRWVKKCAPDPAVYVQTRDLLGRMHLNTVCESAQCPNQGTCFAKGTATFLLLGTTCTRNCSFCAVDHGTPRPPDPEEPLRISQAVSAMKIRHAVLTSVTRDDLPDGGALQFSAAIEAIRNASPDVMVEVLIPDFRGSRRALFSVLDSRPHVLNHNIETVPRLYPRVRPQADYQRSLQLLREVKEHPVPCFSKSGLMVGLGESEDEVLSVMTDLRQCECDLLTIGQYLRPSFKHHPIVRRVEEDEFDRYRVAGERMGFKAVFSSRLVRSSFMAGTVLEKAVRS
jgi:lipoic acid synthetase